jgi:hypothetical protein
METCSTHHFLDSWERLVLLGLNLHLWVAILFKV